MRHLCFAASLGVALAVAPRPAAGQRVPGRDLLDFDVGALGEAPALATQLGGGLYNPAAPLTGQASRLRGALAHLNGQGERALTAELAAIEWRWRPRLAVHGSFVRSGVSDIVGTDANPTVSTGDVLYDTMLLSVGAAYRVVPHVAVGAALRHRIGRADTTRASTTGGDAGIVVDGLLGARDLRLGASTFLWRPNATRDDRPVRALAADLRVAGVRPTAEGRLGASLLDSRYGEREGYVYGAGRYGLIEGRAGVARASGFGSAETRYRFGLGLHYARFTVAVAREDNGLSLGSLYQFTLSSIFR